MKIEVSNGEIIDKLTILQIKLERIDDPGKLANINKEYSILFPLAKEILPPDHQLIKDLKNINFQLWEIEDNIRELERNSAFGEDFVDLARSVYKCNDERARLKKEINTITNSSLTEEKSYKEY